MGKREKRKNGIYLQDEAPRSAALFQILISVREKIRGD